jgi:transcriptional regulator with XRE-family HTH domain
MSNKGDFAIRLVELFKKNKVTTATLSKATDISEITINKMRNGQNINPTVSTLLAIANYFRVSIDYLINGAAVLPSKSIKIMDLDNIGAEAMELSTADFFSDADFAVRITNNNYKEYKKNSLVLISQRINYKNDDIILVKLNGGHALCTLIVEGGMYIGKSLTVLEKYHDINVENILGIVTGVIWKIN